MQLSIAPDLTPTERDATLNRLADIATRDPIVQTFALASMRAALASGDASVESIVRAALARVQSLGYHEPPSPGLDPYQDHRETLARGGDCKALSTLLVAVLRVLGLRAWVAWITQNDAQWDHASVLVELRPGSITWADPSMAGAMLGESPREASQRLRLDRVGLWTSVESR